MTAQITPFATKKTAVSQPQTSLLSSLFDSIVLPLFDFSDLAANIEFDREEISNPPMKNHLLDQKGQ